MVSSPSPSPYTLVLLGLGITVGAMFLVFSPADASCNGPIQANLRFDTAQFSGEAEEICCHNSMFAERAGLFEELGLFQGLNKDGETTFYDSVCGVPLFKAPQGRSFQAWQEESIEHGWPSFRSQEVFAENLRTHPFTGEVQSTCGTHLGHNIPDDLGDRYCIDLICIAGHYNHSTGSAGSPRTVTATASSSSLSSSSSSLLAARESVQAGPASAYHRGLRSQEALIANLRLAFVNIRASLMLGVLFSGAAVMGYILVMGKRLWRRNYTSEADSAATSYLLITGDNQ